MSARPVLYDAKVRIQSHFCSQVLGGGLRSVQMLKIKPRTPIFEAVTFSFSMTIPGTLYRYLKNNLHSSLEIDTHVFEVNKLYINRYPFRAWLNLLPLTGWVGRLDIAPRLSSPPNYTRPLVQSQSKARARGLKTQGLLLSFN